MVNEEQKLFPYLFTLRFAAVAVSPFAKRIFLNNRPHNNTNHFLSHTQSNKFRELLKKEVPSRRLLRSTLRGKIWDHEWETMWLQLSLARISSCGVVLLTDIPTGYFPTSFTHTHTERIIMTGKISERSHHNPRI